MSTQTITFNGRIDSHPMHKQIYDLMQEIEKLPASEQQTKIITLAGELQNGVAAMRAVFAGNAVYLRRNAEECFPVEEGKKHFARLIMEGVADDLEEASSPSV